MKGQVRELLPVLIVPLALIIFVAVYSSFSANTLSTFETTVVNESIASSGLTLTVAYPSIASITRVGNTSHTLTAVTEYNLTNWENGVITLDSVTLVDGTYDVSYVGHSGEGYIVYTKVNSGTWGGFKLASLVPYVIIAMIVLGVLVGALLFR